jgi:thioredoxin reductase (NADPH)
MERITQAAMGNTPSIVETRAQQLFPVFTESELHRLRRFGVTQRYIAGATVVGAGEPTDGLLFILSGTVAVTVRGTSGDAQQTATYGPGAFVGELADLSGRPSLVTVKALHPLSALMVSAEGLHAFFKRETQVAERIIRALILRHSGLIEKGCAIIIGAASNPDTQRTERLLQQNGHPHQTLDSGADEIARSVIVRLKLDDSELPIVLCPNGRLLCSPTDGEVALAMRVGGTAAPDAT